MLATNNYNVKVLNLEDMSKSDKFNFFAYIQTEKDILISVDNLIANTSSEQSSNRNNDDFWIKSERALLVSLIAYIIFECNEDEKNISSLLELISIASVKENDEEYISALDILMTDLEQIKPNCLSVYMYKTFKLAGGVTAKSILVSLGVRLAPFAIDEVQKLLEYDELDFELLAKEKTALFLIVPETYTTYNFLVCILYQQMLETLYAYAKKQKNRKCPIHVQIIGDEIANIGQIPNLQRYISTMRSYEISIILIFQALTQVEAMDKENWKTIVGNCDTFIYLGGKEQSTNEYVSKSIGKATIDQRQNNVTKGSHGSWGLQDSTLGRDLLDPAEMEKIEGDKCIVMISGIASFYSEKFALESHERYKLLADFNGIIFDYERRNQLEVDSIINDYTEKISIQIEEF